MTYALCLLADLLALAWALSEWARVFGAAVHP